MGFKIGELAKNVGVSIQTIHYYERRGLLAPTARLDSGYRLYDKEAEKRLKFIRYSKNIGFTLREIDELLKLKISETAKCRDIKKRAEEKLIEINNKIKGLQSMRKVLQEMIKICPNEQSTDHCPILKTIDQKGENI